MMHTPGPWMVDATKSLGAYGVWTDYSTHPGHDGAGCGSQICSVLPDSKEIPRDQRDANARLIAAAPELLRIARILETFRVAGADSVSFSALLHDGDDTLGQAVRAAIAKATQTE